MAVSAESAPGPVQVEHGGFTVRSNSGSIADLHADLGVESPATAHTQPETPVDPGDEDPDSAPAPLKAQEKHDRIQRLTFEREEAKREAAEAKAEAARLKADRTAAPAEPEPRRTEDEAKQYADWSAGLDAADPKPSVTAFDDHDEYLDARDAWNERRFERRAVRADQERRHYEQHQQVQQAATQFRTRMDEESAADPAFKAMLSNIQIPGRGPVFDVFLTTTVAPQMVRHFDAHPEDLQRILSLGPGGQLAEIKKLEGKLEARLEAAPSGSAVRVKPTTKAQPPINPVVGSHVAASDEMPGDDATDEAYYAWEARQRKAKR